LAPERDLYKSQVAVNQPFNEGAPSLAPEHPRAAFSSVEIGAFNEGAPSLAPEPETKRAGLILEAGPSMRGRQAWRPN